MKKEALVIGLGQFGMSLARSLATANVEVLAIDQKEELVREASSFATEALRLDATEENALANLNPAARDVCVCALGDESREASILTTAMLRQMGADFVVARATDATHGRILELVGAHEVVRPEQAFGERLATHLLHRDVVDELVVGPDLVLTELHAPAAFDGRTLAELELPRRFGVTVVAWRVGEGADIESPDPSRAIAEGELLLVVARRGVVARLLEKVS